MNFFNLKKINNVSQVFNIAFIFFLIIFIKAFYSPTGYLGPDATWYLKAADNIIKLKFLFFSELIVYGIEIEKYKDYGSFFAVWPPLYPILIALTSFFLSVDLFIASKIVNFICFLIIYYILKKYIASNLLIFFIFCNATIIEIYSYSLTEFLLITLLILLIHNLNIYFLNNNKIQLVIIFLILNLIFLTRYNGLSAHLAIICLSLYFLLFEKKLYFKLILVTLFAIIISFIYLLIIKELTGNYTGYPRTFRDEIISQVFYVFKAFAIEVNYILSSTINNFNINENNWNLKYLFYVATFLIQILPLFIIKIKKNILKERLNEIINNKINLIIIIFLICYLIPILFLTIITKVDPIYFRSMSPATFLVFFMFFLNIKNLNLFYKNYIIYLISLSIFINVLIPIYIFR